MVCAHTKVKVCGMKGKLMGLKKNEAIKDLLACHKNVGIKWVFYDIWAAFCVVGVFSLMVCVTWVYETVDNIIINQKYSDCSYEI